MSESLLLSASPPLVRRRHGVWRLVVPLVVSSSLLTLLIVEIGPENLLATLSSVDLSTALGTIMLLLAWLFLGAMNLWILLRRHASLSIVEYVPIYLASWTVAQVLPGQVGDASQIWMLRRHRIEIAQSTAAYLVDKSISLVWRVVIAAIGVAVYLPGPLARITASRALLPTAVALAALAALGVVLSLRRLRRVGDGVRAFLDSLGAYRRAHRVLLLNAAGTIAKWVVVSAVYWLAFRAFAVPVPVLAAATLPILSSLVGHLPLSLGGAGTSEWAAVFLFGLVGASPSAVLSTYLFIRGALLLAGAPLVAPVLFSSRRVAA